MKKWLFISVLILLLFFSACSPTTNNNSSDVIPPNIALTPSDYYPGGELFDKERTDWPSEEEVIARIKKGMNYVGVVEAIGKAYRDIGSGRVLFEYKLSNGKTMVIDMTYNQVNTLRIDDNVIIQ